MFGQHARKEVNVELKNEAEFFGDIVIVPYMDNYDLVVLKTVAISEYGVSSGMLLKLENLMLYITGSLSFSMSVFGIRLMQFLLIIS